MRRKRLKRLYVNEDDHKKIKIGAVMKQKPIIDYVSDMVKKEVPDDPFKINIKKNDKKSPWFTKL